MVGFTPQLHTGLLGLLSLSSWPPKLATVALPIVIGRMHDQQMSVMGFGNLPVHVAIGAAVASRVGRLAASTAQQSNERFHLITTSSMRRREPSWETIAGTAVMPSLRTSVPSWS